jgi:hypothetical protein
LYLCGDVQLLAILADSSGEKDEFDNKTRKKNRKNGKNDYLCKMKIKVKVFLLVVKVRTFMV